MRTVWPQLLHFDGFDRWTFPHFSHFHFGIYFSYPAKYDKTIVNKSALYKLYFKYIIKTK